MTRKRRYLKSGELSESAFQSDLLKLLKLSGYYCYKQNVISGFFDGKFLSSGVPEGASDLIILSPTGVVIFCELKSAKGKQRASQILFQKEIESRGGIYLLLSGKDSLNTCLKKIRVVVDKYISSMVAKNQFKLSNK